MSKYNDAELHAIKELDPPGFTRWQLPGLDPDLEWYSRLESQVSPPPGVPFLRCDCIGRLPLWVRNVREENAARTLEDVSLAFVGC